jgi:hypothetical protein
MRRIIATAGLMALASAPNAYAETVMLDVAPKAQLQMQVPQGFCPVRASQSDLDKALLAFFERSLHGEAKLLAFFVDCKAYAELGTGSYAPHSWILVLAPLDPSGNAATLPGATRAQVLDAAAKRAAADTEASFTNVAFADAQEAGSTPEVSGQSRPLGVLDKDENAVYQGLLTRVNSNGTSGNVAGLINSTFVAGHLININAYAVYDTPQAFEDLIEFSKAVTKDFVSANEQPAP